ncbi:3-oxoacyl-ACP reductase FabG [Saccharomonospora sp. NB11]|uniref:3-oxoacyl-ACP reductase FabG n=1 Tax=Saccharomonospora sp. NB11 TaxID=1642298 RepID=UPI0018D1CD25|nr:3-oxoacyl-ACP reductase FabG [Saccharomonospora sp. NB11]
MNGGRRPVALVTGGSRGIGRATALRLAEDGYDVAFCYVSDSDAARSLEKELLDLGAGVYARRTDVSDATSVAALVEGAEDALGPLTAVVNSAGVVRDMPLAMMEDADWNAVLRPNLDGVYHVCRTVVEGMMKRRGGVIVNLSSIAGLHGNPGQANYAAAKAGIVAFTKSVAKEVGRYGIRANVVAPGFIDTDPVRTLPVEVLDRAKQRIPLRRLGTPDEVADLISFLVSDRAAYISGAVFQIDGGM